MSEETIHIKEWGKYPCHYPIFFANAWFIVTHNYIFVSKLLYIIFIFFLF
jgi:hypothetical protein